MQTLSFKAFSVSNEINLNKIAVQCGISKKYTWEEPLILQGAALSGILKSPVREDQKILLFSFGSLVCINMEQQQYAPFIKYLKDIEPDIDLNRWSYYNDDYVLHVAEEGTNSELTDEYVVISEFEPFYTELISIVIAKSVALERVEEHLGGILDGIEGLIERLEKGRLQIGDKALAKTTAKVARHQYDSISYIMILDKPDITWSNSAAQNFYNEMADFFELNDRYEIIKSKTEVLNDIITGFSSISHSMRGMFIELVILILIVVEVVLMLLELLK